jgi:hypothetical protein
LREENAIGVPDAAALQPDFYATIFDLSIGYDLKGIESESVTGFVQQVKHAEHIVGRIKGLEYRLEIHRADDSALFNDGVVVLNIQLSTRKLLSWKTLDPALAKIDPAREPFGHVPDHVVSMVNLYRMEALLYGVLNMKRAHYVNAQYLSV